MSTIINDPLVVMEFPLIEGETADRNTVVRALLEKRADIESTFKNDEYLKLDLTHQELIGLKSTAFLGKMPIGDLPAINYVLSNNDRHNKSKILNLGNVSMVYKHFCS